ncbi:MAG: DUF962 domain-containing protein [Bdellovibrionota bacterium]
MEKPINTWNEFWPFYLLQHQNSTNQRLHFIGTTIGFIAFVFALTHLKLSYLIIGLFFAYLFAWIGHFVYEKNKPATFKYPLWSFIADQKMFLLILRGKMSQELDKIKDQ